MTHKQGVTNDDIMAMLSQFSDTMEKRFEGIDERFDKMDVRFDGLQSDVRALRSDMREVKQSLASLDGRVQALEADTKDIYLMLAKRDSGDTKFSKLSLEKKLLRLNANLLAAAKEAGIVLPR